MSEKKRKPGRPPKLPTDDWDIQIWVRVGHAIKDGLAKYRDRHAFPNDAEAIRHILRIHLKDEGLL